MARHFSSHKQKLGSVRFAAVVAVIMVMLALVVGAARHALPQLGQRASGGKDNAPSTTLAVAVDKGDVSPTYAEAVVQGELTHEQAETLTLLDEYEGTFDTQSIVLQGVGEERAEELAARLGATLRITDDGTYARLALPEGMSITDVLSTAELAGYARSIEPDWYVELAEEADDDGSLGLNATDLNRDTAITFNDPYYASQGYLGYLNPSDVLSRGMASAPLVAVIDTGIDWESPEFAGRISDRSYNATEDKVVADHGWDVITDEQGHGTAVAGVLAASANNSLGVVGVAPDAQLLVIKAHCDKAGRFANVSDLVFGLYYAVEQHAAVVNMSFGTYAPFDPFASAVKLAVDSDVALVAAAGNDAIPAPCYPAANSSVIGIGALDADSYDLAPYSNFGEDDVELVAPGSVVTLHAAGSGNVQATVSNGTSFSAPIVAGAIARYKASNPNVENEQVVERLRASAADLGEPGRDWYFGYGALDLTAFLDGQAGVITFDMLTDELEDQTRLFIVGKALQDVPQPERENATFDGWYHDDQLEDIYDNTTEKLYGNLDEQGIPRVTVYASWTNEDDGQPFTYQAADGADPAHGIEVTSYVGKRRYMTVPEQIDGYTVVGIAQNAFQSNGLIVTATLPDTVTYLGNGSFEDCVRLTSISIPDAVTTVGDYAFKGCARLQTAFFGEKSALTSFGTEAFAGCTMLRSLHLGTRVAQFDGSVVLGDTSLSAVSVAAGNTSFRLADDGVSVVSADGATLVYRSAGLTAAYATPVGATVVGPYALAYSRAEAVTVAEGVVSLGKGALMAASTSQVTLPASLREMGESCFQYASGISELDMSATSVTTIPGHAFMLCTRLTSVQLPARLAEIGLDAFAYSSLSSVELSASVTSIGDEAFMFTPMRSTVLSASLSSLGKHVFAGCYALSSVTFAPNSVLSEIPAYAFADCPGLDAVELPNSVAVVREHAFENSGLRAIDFSPSVQTIEQGAFANCAQLASVTVAEGNATYAAVDNVLFDASRTSLVFYPAGREGDAYEIPNSVASIMGYAFQGATKLRSVTLPAGMTELSAYAFSRCYSLESVGLPDRLQSINVNAFEYCTALESVQIPASVLTVGRYAFYCDSALTSVSFAQGSALSRVGFAAFAYTGLRDVVLPASVSSMGQYAFAGCASLGSFAFADGSALRSIPAYVFDGCDQLSSISFGQGSSLGALSARAFEGLGALTSVDLSGCTSLTEVGNYAFNRCYALSNVSLPAGLQRIGRYAFYGCTSLETLGIPASVSFIGRFAFTSCAPATLYFGSATLPAELQDDWNYGIGGYYLGTAGSKVDGDWVYADASDGTVVAVRYNGSATQVDARSIAGKAVSAIGYGCFRGNTTLTSVTFGSKLNTICDYAFAGTTALGGVSLPAAVTYVGDHAFDGSGIATATFAAGSKLTRIGDSAFAGTPSLASITIPASVDRIGRAAFKGSAIANVTFEAGSALTYVGRQAFQESGIKAIAFPDSIAEIDDYAFYNATSLESLDLGEPADLKIQTHAFYGTALSSVRIPSGVTYIGELAFDGITKLTGIEVDASNPNYLAEDGVLYDETKTAIVSYPAGRGGEVVIPAHVTSIRFGAFEHANVTKVRFEEGSRLTTIGYRAFYGCDSLKSFEVPAGVTSIDRYAFAECDNLATCDVSKAKGLTGIYQGAFYNDAKLTGFALPDSVVEIGDRAFYGCAALQTAVPASSGLRTIGAGAFAYSGVTGLVAPPNLLTIGAEAFRGSALRTLDLNNGVLVEIGTEAFADCADFATTELVIPDTVDCIGYGALASGKDVIESLTMPIPTLADTDLTMDYLFDGTPTSLSSVHVSRCSGLPVQAFAHLESLRSITLPEGLDRINDQAFMGCSALTRVDMPKSMKRIGILAFAGTALTEVDLPEGLLSIEDSAFSDSKLTSIVVPASVTYIGSRAFQGTELSGEVTIPASVSTIGANAFLSNSDDLNIVLDAANKSFVLDNMILYTSDYTQMLWISKKISGKAVVHDGVKLIEAGAFNGCSALTEVHFPDTVTILGNGGGIFYGCSSLKKVNIPSSVETFGHNLFTGSGIEEVVFDEGIVEIPTDFLAWSSNLKRVSLPGSLKRIRDGAFRYCSSLESITIGEGVEDIGSRVFDHCINLKSISLPSTIKRIGGGLYAGCASLEKVTIVGGNNALYKYEDGWLLTADGKTLVCAPPTSNLESLAVPNGVITIGSHAFADSAISMVHIPDSVIELQDYVFENCSNLAVIEGGAGIERMSVHDLQGTALYGEVMRPDNTEPYYLGNCLALVPPSVTSLETREGTVACAEYVCGTASGTNVSSVVLPSSMKSVAPYAFAKESITDVTLNEGLQYIGVGAFMNSKIEKVVLPSTLKSLGSHAFYSINSNLDNSGTGTLRSIVFSPGCSADVEDYAFAGQNHISSIGVSQELADSDGVLRPFKLLFDAGAELNSHDAGLTLVIFDSDKPAADVSLEFYEQWPTGSTIYCYEDPKSTLWHEGWYGDNTVYYLGDWNMATFTVDGNVLSSAPLKAGSIVEAPSAAEVQDALIDDCSYTFLGWDINGNGKADTLPTTLNAYGDLVAEALYTTHTWDAGVRVEPSCVEDGSLTCTCTTCGKTKVETLDALGHAFVAGRVVAPTQFEDGYTVYTCSRCGEVEQRDWVIAIGAEPSGWTVTSPATCEKEGEEAILTPTGHPLQTRAVPALGHEWGEGVVSIEPSCATEGIMTYTCAHDASHTKTEAIAALRHSWGEWEIITEATYDAPGLRRRTCTRCSETEEQEIPQLEWVDAGGISMSVQELRLKPGETVQIVATLGNPDASDPSIRWESSNVSVATVDGLGNATAVAEGVAWISATSSDGAVDRCQVTVQHDHVAGEVVRESEVAATCEQSGSYVAVTRCEKCGVELSREIVEVPATGHAWDEGVVTKEPTCAEPGSRTYTCRNDSKHTYVEPIDALGHVAGNAVRENDVAPTCVTAGSYDLVVACERCGETLSVEHVYVDALGHNYLEIIVEPTFEEQGYTLHRCSRCGDEYATDYTDSLNVVAARGVDARIGALPSVEALSLEDAATVAAARAAYDALTEAQRALVQGLATLEAAEARIVGLQTEADQHVADEAAARGVDAAIAALPLGEDITLNDAVSVRAVRGTYDALTDAQKALVKGLATLEAAEARVAELQEIADQQAADLTAARTVDERIAGLPPVEGLRLEDAASVQEARAAYGTLTDAQKALVRNLPALEAAEARIAELREAAEQPAISFRDVTERTPHSADIAWLASSGISTGWKESDGTRTFRPANTVVRQDMAAFLFRLAKSWGLVDESWQPTGSVTFTDVNPNTPHYREIMWLAESGISAGWKVGSGREFRPRNTVVRQDMAAFLRRLQALRDPSVKDWKPTGDSPFRDVTSSTPHSEDILWLAESGVSAGWKVGDTREFRPTNTVIRQDMAAFLHRLDALG